MKKLLFSFVLLMLGVTANAKSLVLVLSDSTLVYFSLSDTPVMTVSDDKICVNTKEFAFENVERFYISETDAPDGIEDVKAKKAFSYDGKSLIVDGNQNVEVYSVNGTKVDAKVSKANGLTIVNTETLSKGTYVLKLGKSSLKFNKK